MKEHRDKLIAGCLYGVIIAICIECLYFLISNHLLGLTLALGLLGITIILVTIYQGMVKTDVLKSKVAGDIDNILETMAAHTKKYDEIIKKLEAVYHDLNLLSSDLKVHRPSLPLLTVTFPNNEVEINLRTGTAKEITVFLHNMGDAVAESPTWRLFFPSDVDLLNAGKGLIVQQQHTFPFYQYPSAHFKADFIRSKTKVVEVIKLKIPTSYPKDTVKIPFKCTAKNIAPATGELVIKLTKKR